jgi:hypothetical protein
MEFIVLGGVIFWILTSLLLIGVFASIHHERGSWATAGLVAYFLILAVFGSFDLTGFVFRNPIMLLVIAAGYFLLGIAWTFVKWHFFVSTQRRKFDAYKTEWLEKQGITDGVMPDEMKKRWTEAAREYAKNGPDHGGEYGKGRSYISENQLRTGTQILDAIKPKVSRNKGRIIFWLSYWPFSFLWTFLADGVMAVWEYIYHGIGKKLQRVSDSKFKNAGDDFAS